MDSFIRRVGRCAHVGWRLLRSSWQVVYGMYKITRLPNPCVSIFGGSKIMQDSEYANMARVIAERLVNAGISILTGGGPGIMEAANCGAAQVANATGVTRSMGIDVAGLEKEQPPNACATEMVVLDYFFSRKWLLINYSIGFCIFPGGFGTMDELSDLLNLMATHKLAEMPVVLMGAEYWKSYASWLEVAAAEGLVSRAMISRIVITDDVDIAITHLVSYCKSCVTPRRA